MCELLFICCSLVPHSIDSIYCMTSGHSPHFPETMGTPRAFSATSLNSQARQESWPCHCEVEDILGFTEKKKAGNRGTNSWCHKCPLILSKTICPSCVKIYISQPIFQSNHARWEQRWSRKCFLRAAAWQMHIVRSVDRVGLGKLHTSL